MAKKAYNHPVYRAAKKRLKDAPCYWCGADTSGTVDHVVELINGGTNTPDNLVAACARCNYSRGGKVGASRRRNRRVRRVESRGVGGF